MAHDHDDFNIKSMTNIVSKALGGAMLYKTRREHHWWWRDGDVVRGARLFLYSPEILRLTTVYAYDAADRALSRQLHGKVQRFSYELSFLESEAPVVVPWAISDLSTPHVERPCWAYSGYWHRDDRHAYLWSLAGWTHAEEYRARKRGLKDGSHDSIRACTPQTAPTTTMT